MYRHLNIGPAVVETALILYLLGFYISGEVARRHAKRHGLDGNAVQNALIIGLLVGIIGARLAYIFQHWAIYREDLGGWISLTPQALAIPAGLLAGTAASLGYAYWRKLALRPFLESIAPGLGLFMVILGLALLARGGAFGQASDLPWAIDLWGETRHPTQLYASIGGALTLGAWWYWRLSLLGRGFAFIVAGNALTWLLVGLLLAEPELVLNTYRTLQVVAWAALVAATLGWAWWSQLPYQPGNLSQTE
ncbi:MAG: prolipoprotein diacylglyceryl transferase [Chloroflexi bacterium]|nr:prolipoprotein diacylglyceryl transferase [Chloroflexota bacterium]